MVSRNRVIATAYGFRSTPWIASSAFCTRARLSMPGAWRCQRSSSRANAPSRKWPDPQVGSISRKPSSGRSLQRRLQGAVEDELLHEYRRLQQRVPRLAPPRTGPGRGRRGSGCPACRRGGPAPARRSRRARRQKSSSRVAASPEGVTSHSGEVSSTRAWVAGSPARYEMACCSHSRSVTSGLAAASSRRNFACASQRLGATVPGPGDPHRLDESVVLDEADEDGDEYPRHRGEGDPVLGPLLPRCGGTAAVPAPPGAAPASRRPQWTDEPPAHAGRLRGASPRRAVRR